MLAQVTGCQSQQENIWRAWLKGKSEAMRTKCGRGPWAEVVCVQNSQKWGEKERWRRECRQGGVAEEEHDKTEATTVNGLEKISKIVARSARSAMGYGTRLAFRRTGIQLLPFPPPSSTHLYATVNSLFVKRSTGASISQPTNSHKPTDSQHQRKNLSFVSNSLNQTSFQTQHFILIFYNPNKSMRKKSKVEGTEREKEKGKQSQPIFFSLMREEKIKGLLLLPVSGQWWCFFKTDKVILRQEDS